MEKSHIKILSCETVVRLKIENEGRERKQWSRLWEGRQLPIRDVLRCVQFSATPWTVAHQASLSMKCSKQEYWSGLPFPIPGDFPNPRIEPVSLASPALAGGSPAPSGKPTVRDRGGKMIHPKVVCDTKAKGREVQGAGVSSANYCKKAEEDEYWMPTKANLHIKWMELEAQTWPWGNRFAAAGLRVA